MDAHQGREKGKRRRKEGVLFTSKCFVCGQVSACEYALLCLRIVRLRIHIVLTFFLFLYYPFITP